MSQVRGTGRVKAAIHLLLVSCMTAGILAVMSGVASAAPNRDLHIVTLGDSYTAGNGSPGVKGDCERSAANYAGEFRRLARITGLFQNLACSGAVTGDIRGQLNQAVGKESVELAFISIGGNDLEFGKAVEDCFVPFKSTEGCHKRIAYADEKFVDVSEGVKDAIRLVLGELSRARVVVVGYPQLRADGVAAGPGFDAAASFRRLGRAMDEATASIVSSLQAEFGDRIVYVSRSLLFAGHEVGTKHPWIHGIYNGECVSTRGTGCYHPNQQGWTETGRLLARLGVHGDRAPRLAGGADLAAYCATQGQEGHAVLRYPSATGWRCETVKSKVAKIQRTSVDMTAVCARQHHPRARSVSGSGPNDWSCRTEWGGVNFAKWCATQGDNGKAVLISADASGWRCDIRTGTRTVEHLSGTNLNTACTQQYGSEAGARVRDSRNAYSWYCQRGGSELGGIDVAAYCATRNGDVRLLDPNDAFSWRCRTTTTEDVRELRSIDVGAACAAQHHPSAKATAGRGPGSWRCRTEWGGTDVPRWCADHGATARLISQSRNGWRCERPNGFKIAKVQRPIDMTAACKRTHQSVSSIRAILVNSAPDGWQCWTS